jgi:hypothetical protein
MMRRCSLSVSVSLNVSVSPWCVDRRESEEDVLSILFLIGYINCT